MNTCVVICKRGMARIAPPRSATGWAAVPLILLLGPLHAARADSLALPPWFPQLLGGQATLIGQHLLPFDSPYSGKNSLTPAGDYGLTETYGIYFGSQITRGLQAYVDVEMARGHGVSNATGLGGITNGDVIRQGTADLGKGPYLARGFLRYVVPLSSDSQPKEKGMDQLAGADAVRRIEVKAGKLAATDDFDLNRYADSTRTQFLNWGLFNNTAWDFAADTRGYSKGVMVGYVAPRWAIRFGSYQMPTQANGNIFDPALSQARGDNLELTLEPDAAGTVVRLLGYQNHARMGIYHDAIVASQGTGQPPSIVADDQPGRRKRGFGVNLEQPLADDGETGIFLRAGWNDGHTESFAFTEVDAHMSAGLQVSGAHWSRTEDRLGIAYVRHLLSADHRDYLAAGGNGFLLGDGKLNYGPEQIAEAYYRIQLGRYVHISPDWQFIQNPGYNRDRGPAGVVSLRLRAAF